MKNSLNLFKDRITKFILFSECTTEGLNMIDQKNIIIGTVLALVLVFLFGLVLPFIGGIIAMIVASIVVGYMVNENVKNGAMHGSVVGFLTGVIYILLIYAIYGFSKEIVSVLITLYLLLIPIYVLLGLGGGIIGSVIKTRRNYVKISEEPGSEEVPPEQTEKKE